MAIKGKTSYKFTKNVYNFAKFYSKNDKIQSN